MGILPEETEGLRESMKRDSDLPCQVKSVAEEMQEKEIKKQGKERVFAG